MEVRAKLISKTLKGGDIRLDAVFLPLATRFEISASGGDLNDFHTEYFLDVNTAIRVFANRARMIQSGTPIPTWCYHQALGSDEYLSAPVPGLRAYLENIRPAGGLEKNLQLLLAPWNPEFDIEAGTVTDLGIPDHGLVVRRETTSEGHDLGLYLVKHPAKAMVGRYRFVLRLASLKDTDGTPSEENVEYFYDLTLARRAFEQRLSDDRAEPTRLGMEGGTPVSHFDHRNAILVEDAISIRRSDAGEILTLMLRSGLFEECKGLYHHLNDARSAAYSGNLVKWLGSVMVEPDGSGIYSKGRTKPFEMHIKVEVPPREIERAEDGSIGFALCYFSGHYNHEEWHEDPDFRDLPYTDAGVENSVNAFLRDLGYDGAVNWSEHGRQNAEEADFDMDYELIDQIWPELRKELAASSALSA